jgi:FtsZ-interacting cell division protein YlmF
MGLFNKKKTEEDVKKEITSYDEIVFLKLNEITDEKLLMIADDIILNKPCVVNFDIDNIDEINKAIAFLSGVCYVLHGEAIAQQRKVLVFGSKMAFEDGSVKDFLKSL